MGGSVGGSVGQWLGWWVGDRRSMDREGLIICIAIWTLYKLGGLSTCGEVREVPIASRNKLRSASLWQAIFKDFGPILGGFEEPKLRPK